MAIRSVEAAPRDYARAGGALYLALIVLGVFGELVRTRVVVPGDAAATAARLTSMETLWRLGIGAELVALVCTTGLAMIYFVLLRPVHREINLLATFLRMVGIAVQTVAVLNLVAAEFPLGNVVYLQGLSPIERDTLATLEIRAHGHGFGLALLFFGCCFLFHGYLIFRSGFLPRVLGILIQIAGLAYLTNSFALFLAPALADRLFPLILLPAFVGEASLCLWLLVKGVDEERWREVDARAS